jgi:hypothetical protein
MDQNAYDRCTWQNCTDKSNGKLDNKKLIDFHHNRNAIQLNTVVANKIEN